MELQNERLGCSSYVVRKVVTVIYVEKTTLHEVCMHIDKGRRESRLVSKGVQSFKTFFPMIMFM